MTMPLEANLFDQTPRTHFSRGIFEKTPATVALGLPVLAKIDIVHIARIFFANLREVKIRRQEKKVILALEK